MLTENPPDFANMPFEEAVRVYVCTDWERLRAKYTHAEELDPYVACIHALMQMGLTEVNALKVVISALAETRKSMSAWIDAKGAGASKL